MNDTLFFLLLQSKKSTVGADGKLEKEKMSGKSLPIILYSFDFAFRSKIQTGEKRQKKGIYSKEGAGFRDFSVPLSIFKK